MAKKRALGKGLAALISEIDNDSKTEQLSEINEVKISDIQFNPYQPRKNFSEDEIKELAESIKSTTLLNPISLNQTEDGSFVLISGERRLRAFKYLGKTIIPARIFSVDEEQLSLLALIENIQRVDLNDVEKAQACKKIKEKFSYSDEAISGKIGVSRSQVTNLMRLLTLSEKVLASLRDSRVTVGQVRPLVGLNNEEQEKILEKILKSELNSRDVENLVKTNKQTNKSFSLPKKERVFETEKALSEIIGTKKIKVFKNRGKYQITLEFKDENEINSFVQNIK